MLELVLSTSNVLPSHTSVSDLPDDSPFLAYLNTLKDTLKLSRLVKKLMHWFKDGRKGSFSYRFTGKETKVFCRKFGFVIQSLSNTENSPQVKLRLAALAFCGQQLRDAISYFSRVNINEQEIKMCQQACQHFYNICALLFKEVTPTVWTIGYAVPRHLKILFDKYKVGLGINSMQGREAKHVRLAQFAMHSTKYTRWSMVLRHDYICMYVWIRKQDPGHNSYSKYQESYIPKVVSLENYCYCGFPIGNQGSKCHICSSSIYMDVAQTAECGTLDHIAKYIKLKK